jgi:hypothetical protein
MQVSVDPLQDHNKNGMQLQEGDGNSSPDGASEGDRFNTVWVLDSTRLPFYRAEAYHQFHDGIGKPFSPDYKVPGLGLLSNACTLPTSCHARAL